MPQEQNLSQLFAQEQGIRLEQSIRLELDRRREFNQRFAEYLGQFIRLKCIPLQEIKPKEFGEFGLESILVYPDLQNIIQVCDFKIKEADTVVDNNEVNLIFSVLGDLSKFSLSLNMFYLLVQTLERSRLERSFDQNILSPLDSIKNSDDIEINFTTPSFPEVMNKFLTHPKYFNNRDSF
jgi:hypothetical protein